MGMLLNFLALVAANDDKNKMGIANLAVVFAPSLFYVRGHKGQKMLKEVEMQVGRLVLARFPPRCLIVLPFVFPCLALRSARCTVVLFSSGRLWPEMC